MNEFYQNVLHALQKEDKETAFKLFVDALRKHEISVVDLYEMVLTPALANVIEEYAADEDLIWREHVRSAIIRTIIEQSYPYVLEQQKKAEAKENKVIVMCPEFEEHELGARMVADFFRLEGYDTTFIGARTPIGTVLKAIDVVKPTYLVISVTGFYNLLSVKRTIQAIKDAGNEDLVFVIGGRAISANPAAAMELGADKLLESFDAIKNLDAEEK